MKMFNRFFAAILAVALVSLSVLAPSGAFAQDTPKAAPLTVNFVADAKVKQMANCSDRIGYFWQVARRLDMPQNGQTALWVFQQVKSVGPCVRG